MYRCWSLSAQPNIYFARFLPYSVICLIQLFIYAAVCLSLRKRTSTSYVFFFLFFFIQLFVSSLKDKSCSTFPTSHSTKTTRQRNSRWNKYTNSLRHRALTLTANFLSLCCKFGNLQKKKNENNGEKNTSTTEPHPHPTIKPSWRAEVDVFAILKKKKNSTTPLSYPSIE